MAADPHTYSSPGTLGAGNQIRPFQSVLAGLAGGGLFLGTSWQKRLVGKITGLSKRLTLADEPAVVCRPAPNHPSILLVPTPADTPL